MRAKELIPLLALSLILLPLVAGGDGVGTTLVTPPWNHCLGLHRVTQFHLDIYSGYSEDFDDPQGLFCVKLDSEDDPSTSRDDDELTVFGLNSGSNTLIYNKGLTSIGIIDGVGGLRFDNPRSVSGDAKGNLFVADAENDRIVHLTYGKDDELSLAGVMTGPESDPLDDPMGVSYSGGKIYVADRGKDRIAVFDADGRFGEIVVDSPAGETLSGPTSIAAVTEGDDWLYYNDHYIAVIDSLGRRLWRLSTDGTAFRITRFPQMRGGFGHLAIDYYGNIYATDPTNGYIHKYDRHLNYIAALGESGAGLGQFDEPRGIAIYRRFGQVFISERAGAQYFWIGTDVLRFAAENLTIDRETGRIGVDVSFLLTEHSNVSLLVRDERGEEKFVMLKDYLLPAGAFRRHIEVEAEGMELLANCKLRLVIVAKPTYSSRSFLTVSRESAFLEAELISSLP